MVDMSAGAKMIGDTQPKAPPPPPVDASVKAAVSKDRLTAYVRITPPENSGAGPTEAAIRNALSEQRVVFGIDESTVARLISHPVYDEFIEIAHGAAPVNGKDGSYALRFEADKSLQPRVREDGTVDYRDMDIVENVSAGQVLCNIMLPTEGEPGRSVRDEMIPQVRGKAVSSLCGNNTRLSEDGTAVLSKIAGQVDFRGKKVNVNETFFIKDHVDNSTGNIKAAGNISIGGMVYPNFIVEAGGNIEVRGTVEWATLRAGGNIVLRAGSTGSTLICGGDLTGKFIENCNVSVKGTARVEYLMSSNVRCGKTLSVVGLIAKIVGGTCMVGEDIIAKAIGSPMGAQTILELGCDPVVLERQQELRRVIPEAEKKLASLRSIVNLLQQLDAAGRITSDKKEQLGKALYSLQTGCRELDSNRQELQDISELIRKKGFGRIVCTGTIFPGTRVTIGAEKMSVSDPLYNTSLYLSQNGDGIVQGPAR